MDPLRKERRISLDDNGVNYSPGGTDWRLKYNEVLDMLAETKAELDEFHHASKELEAELESELARTEQAQQDLKIKVAKAEMERDDWKSKFMSLQTNHNTTTTSLQRELDKLRQEYQIVKVQLRDLEMGNDDLERNERAISSSLADMEAKYSKVLEEKILLEQDLLEKVRLEEEMQRLKDELRDANEENTVVKNRLSAAEEAATEAARQVIKLQQQRTAPVSKPDLFNPAADLDLADLSLTQTTPRAQLSTPKTFSLTKSVTQGALQRASLYTKESPLTALRPGSLARSLYTSSPTGSSSRLPTRGTPIQPSISESSTNTTTTTSTTASKRKGALQMAAEMGARIRNFDQRLGTKVPRLRMGSITGRGSMSSNTSTAPSARESASSVASTSSTAKTSLESHRRSISRASIDSFEKAVSKKEKDSGTDSGWVLIMEDSPSPQKPKKDRRLSNPIAPTSFKGANRAKSPSLSTGPQSMLAKSTSGPLRRPLSRMSGTSLTTGTSGTSLPSPVSRPTTPTFLPIPTGGFSNSSAALRRSTGPNLYNAGKRASLGASTPGPSPQRRERPLTQPPLPRPIFDKDEKALPQLPAHNNVTVRAKSSSGSGITAVLSKSRIGRPTSNSQRRTTSDGMQDMKARIYNSPQRPGR